MIFGKKSQVETSQGIVGDFLDRGVERIYPSREFLEAKMKRGEPLSMYLGIDPTGPTLHMGHAIVLKKLREFQKLGHKVILLIGDFTGMIGDPTDKLSARKQLTKEEVLENSRLYQKQASIFLDFSGSNKAELKYNSAWLSKMNFGDVINLASKMTVDQMLKRDMFAKRMEENKPVFIHEFLYPLMQGYDSVAMDVDGEIGGNDQTFNMLTGRDLMKEMLGKEKFVITMKLLADSSGKKMGKTENNGISLADSAEEMYGKVMSWTDGMIVSGFELCTDVLMDDIDAIKKDLESGANPRDAKMRLAREIVTVYHGAASAKQAEENFINTFTKGGVPEDIKSVKVPVNTPLVDVLLREGIVSSKTEFRRLYDEGAITILETGSKIPSPESGADQSAIIKIDKSATYKIGKRRFLKIEEE